jgi:hypothetical protein
MSKLTTNEILVVERVKLIKDLKLQEEKDNAFIKDLEYRIDEVFVPEIYKRLEFTFAGDSGIYSVDQLIKGLGEDLNSLMLPPDRLEIIEKIYGAIATLYIYGALHNALNLAALDPVKIVSTLLNDEINDSIFKSLLRGHVEKICAILDELRKFIKIFTNPDINIMMAPIFCYNIDYTFGRKIVVKCIHHKAE